MSKIFPILLFIFMSCSQSEEPVVEKLYDNKELDSLIVLADETINNLNTKKKNTEEAQRKLNKKLLNVVKLRKHYKDSLDNLRSLKLINRDSIIYDYKIEVCEIVDTVRVNIPDSICPVCVHKKEKSFFNIFKKKK